MPQREVIPPEIIDPLGTLTTKQRAMRAWYLRNREAHMARSRLNFWKDRERQLLLRRERYYISRYIQRRGNLEALFEYSVDVLERTARAFRKQAWKAVIKANHGQALAQLEDGGEGGGGGLRDVREDANLQDGTVCSGSSRDECAASDAGGDGACPVNPPPSPVSGASGGGSVYDGGSLYAATDDGYVHLVQGVGDEGDWSSTSTGDCSQD